MLRNQHSILAIALAGLFAFACTTINAYGQQSGQRVFANSSVEPAIDSSTGGTEYLLTPIKAPFPSKANPVATAPLYLPLYPLSSTIAADDLDCQPTNCDHANVLPFPNSDYGLASAQLRGLQWRPTMLVGKRPRSPGRSRQYGEETSTLPGR
jgi:hypothetical protein